MHKIKLEDQKTLGIYLLLHSVLLTIFSIFATLQITEELVPFFIISCIAIIRLSKLSSQGLQGIFESFFFLFVYVFLSITPMLQISTNTKPLPFEVTNQDYMKAGYLILLSLAFYFFGGRFQFIRFGRIFERQVNERIVPVFTWFAILTSSAIAFSFDVRNLFKSREELNLLLFSSIRVDNSIGAITSALLCVPIFIAMICELQWNSRATKNGRFRFLLVTSLNVIVNNPIAQSRFWFSTVWGSYILILIYRRKEVRTKLMLIFIIGTLVIFPYTDIFRYKGSTFQLNKVNPIIQLTQKGDFDSIEQIAWGMKVSNDQGYFFGRQVLGAGSFFIPRSIWNNKPVDTGIYLAKKAGYQNTSLSAPIWVEAFVDFGVVGTCLYLMIIGVFHSTLRNSIARNMKSVWVVFAIYQLVILRGSLIQSMAGTFSIVISCLILTKRKIN